MAEDILMIAEPKTYRPQKAKVKTLFLSAEEFYQNEKLAKGFSDVLWQVFHTRGKYARVARHVEYVVVAVDAKGTYLGSLFIVPVGAKWLLEYVMTSPNQQGKGVGSAVMDKVLREAKRQKVQWVILNCDPEKNSGQLPRFYAKFGFQEN